MKLSFRYGAFGIEEKMVSISFGGAAGHESGHLVLRLPGWLRQPKRHMALGQTRAPHGAWATLPLLRPDPRVTWCLGLGKRLDCLWQTRRWPWWRPRPTLRWVWIRPRLTWGTQPRPHPSWVWLRWAWIRPRLTWGTQPRPHPSWVWLVHAHPQVGFGCVLAQTRASTPNPKVGEEASMPNPKLGLDASAPNHMC